MEKLRRPELRGCRERGFSSGGHGWVFPLCPLSAGNVSPGNGSFPWLLKPAFPPPLPVSRSPPAGPVPPGSGSPAPVKSPRSDLFLPGPLFPGTPGEVGGPGMAQRLSRTPDGGRAAAAGTGMGSNNSTRGGSTCPPCPSPGRGPSGAGGVCGGRVWVESRLPRPPLLAMSLSGDQRERAGLSTGG